MKQILLIALFVLISIGVSYGNTWENRKTLSLGEKEIYKLCLFNLEPDPSACGLDNDPELSNQEAIFLNEYLGKSAQANDFDFEHKRILFITGNNGKTLGSKVDYFKDVRAWKVAHNAKISTSLHLLSEQEKIAYGYDAIVTYWVKLFPRKTKKVLRKIR